MDYSRSVLIFEQDRAFAEVLVELLEDAGIDARATGSIDQALRLLALGRFAALVSDVGLPRKEGLALLTQVLRRWPWLPVILMSGAAEHVRQSEIACLSAADVIAKPFHANRLIESLGAALRPPPC